MKLDFRATDHPDIISPSFYQWKFRLAPGFVVNTAEDGGPVIAADLFVLFAIIPLLENGRRISGFSRGWGRRERSAGHI